MILDETPTEPGQTPPPDLPPSQQNPGRVRVGRYGELEEHELLHLLDSFDTERERARFRESIYISIFIWILISWVVFYGPRYLWHAPKLRSPADVLREREMTQLTMPNLPKMAAPATKPAPAPRPALDNKTLEKLRAMSKATPAAAPAKPPPPAAATPTPPVASPALPVAPAPQPARTPPPVVADAPTPQPTRPNFGSTPSASESMRNALNGAMRGHGAGDNLPRSGGGRSSPLNLGGAEILSDTQGVNFDPYLRKILSDIYRNWLPLIPQEVMPPLSKEGQAYIRFSILPDGTIGSMHLDGSTHDEAINRSCWGSITGEGQFPPLPSQFHGPNLELRIHYIVSHQAQQ